MLAERVEISLEVSPTAESFKDALSFLGSVPF
jgi:hypothetical protein